MTRRHGKNDEPDPDLPAGLTCNLSVLDQAEEVLNNAAQNARLVPTVEYIERVERKSDRNRNIIIAAVLLIATLALVIGAVAYNLSIQNATQIAVNKSAIDTYNEAIVQLKAKGVPDDQLPPPPVLTNEPSPGESVNVDGLIEAASAKVLADIRGNPAFAGPEGKEGPGGPPGEPCDPAINPACVGPEGPGGQPGTPGTPGTNGVDGVNGAPGGEGPKGDTGDTGRGITNTKQVDPCTRRVDYSDNTSEFWNTCPAPVEEPSTE